MYYFARPTIPVLGKVKTLSYDSCSGSVKSLLCTPALWFHISVVRADAMAGRQLLLATSAASSYHGKTLMIVSLS